MKKIITLLSLIFAAQSSYAATFNCDHDFHDEDPNSFAFFKGELQVRCYGPLPQGKEYSLSFDQTGIGLEYGGNSGPYLSLLCNTDDIVGQYDGVQGSASLGFSGTVGYLRNVEDTSKVCGFVGGSLGALGARLAAGSVAIREVR